MNSTEYHRQDTGRDVSLLECFRRVLAARLEPHDPAGGYEYRQTIIETADACADGSSSVEGADYELSPDELRQVIAALEAAEGKGPVITLEAIIEIVRGQAMHHPDCEADRIYDRGVAACVRILEDMVPRLLMSTPRELTDDEVIALYKERFPPPPNPRAKVRERVMAGEISDQAAALSLALQTDAARYRWLRSEDTATNPLYYPFWQEFSAKLCREERMDELIDSAMTSRQVAPRGGAHG